MAVETRLAHAGAVLKPFHHSVPSITYISDDHVLKAVGQLLHNNSLQPVVYLSPCAQSFRIAPMRVPSASLISKPLTSNVQICWMGILVEA